MEPLETSDRLANLAILIFGFILWAGILKLAYWFIDRYTPLKDDFEFKRNPDDIRPFIITYFCGFFALCIIIIFFFLK